MEEKGAGSLKLVETQKIEVPVSIGEVKRYS